MIKQLKFPLFLFVILNLLITIPLIYLGFKPAAKMTLLVTILQSLIWLLILQVIFAATKGKVEKATVAISMIGVKFIGSLAVVGILAGLGYFHFKLHLFLFLLLYAIYTPITYIYSNRWLQKIQANN